MRDVNPAAQLREREANFLDDVFKVSIGIFVLAGGEVFPRCGAQVDIGDVGLHPAIMNVLGDAGADRLRSGVAMGSTPNDVLLELSTSPSIVVPGGDDSLLAVLVLAVSDAERLRSVGDRDSRDSEAARDRGLRRPRPWLGVGKAGLERGRSAPRFGLRPFENVGDGMSERRIAELHRRDAAFADLALTRGELGKADDLWIFVRTHAL
ncbi:MAG TPA: hypothetical protein VG755_33550 [Nannocystaceae bacterium]|nr:hypothetical protein [Nannocystaceae bacterium]